MDIKEPIIKKLHPHPLHYLSFYLSGIAFFVFGFYFSNLLFLVGLLTFVLAEVSRRAETFFILDSGVSRQYKLFSTSRKFVEYEKIQNIEVSQSFIENIFGIGVVHLDTAGGDRIEVSFHGVKNPYRVENIIREKIR